MLIFKPLNKVAYIRSSRKTIFKPFSTDGLTWQTNTIKYLGVNIPINHDDNISFFKEYFVIFYLFLMK